MFGIFQKPLDEIEIEDIRELVEVRKLREYINLDYKREPYDHGHTGSVNMLADVTAMANSRGGIILIGIEENSKASDGTPASIVGISNGDQEANWIQNICLSCIDVPIPGLKIRDIPIENSKDCVIIYIPDSPRKPHMVVHEKHRSFRIRHGRANTIIGMEEIRQMILSMDSYQSDLKVFISERIEANQINAKLMPFLLLMSTPLYVASDRIDPLNKQYSDLLEKVPGIPNANFNGIKVGKPSPRIYGLETKSNNSQDSYGVYDHSLKLFRNGHFEYYENYLRFSDAEWPQKPMKIEAYRIAVIILHFLYVAKELHTISEQASPLAISLILGNVTSSCLIPKPRYPSYYDKYIWTEPLLHVDISTNMLDKPNQIAINLLDRLHNAYGYEKNILFDDMNNLRLLP